MGYMGDVKSYLGRRKGELNKDFYEWRDHARDLRDFVYPWAGRDLSDMDSYQQETSGRRREQYIYDSTPQSGLKYLAAGMLSNMTNPARPWFQLGIPVPELMEQYDVKLWLDDVERRMYEVFRRSNLYKSFHMGFLELPLFGTWACAVMEDQENVIHCEPFTFGEYRLGQDDNGMVNVCLRRFRTTVRQLVEWFGIDNVGEELKAKFISGNKEEQIAICHLVEPNDETTVEFKEAKGFPYRGAYWVDQGKFQLLEVRGFFEFPVLGPRWDRNGNRVYGNSPCMAALPDIKTLQLMAKDKMTIISKMANPPMLSKGIKWQDIDTAENGISTANGATQSLDPLYNPNPNSITALTQEMMDIRDRINKTMYVDLFRMMLDTTRRQMTAAEVHEKASEKLMLLGPVVESLAHELLDPLINRTFSIMVRMGLIPEPPESIQGIELKIEYISPLAQAQKGLGINAVERFLAYAGGIISLRPEAADKLDADEALEVGADGFGVPTKILKPDDEVQQIRAARAAAAQQERSLMMEQQAAEGAKTLSETQVTPDTNMLQGMMGG